MSGPEDSAPDAEGGYGNSACLDSSGWVPDGPGSPFTSDPGKDSQ